MYDLTMDSEILEVLPLHKHPEFLKETCDLINDEWPRSEDVRMMSLQASCDHLPTSFILVKDGTKVLGHCKLTAIPSIPESCFIETVVISKALRGKKLGTYLMKHIEAYCRNVLQLKMLHLSTKGQEKFYAKLDYEICAPVSIYGCYLPRISMLTTPDSHKIENSVPERTSAPPNGAPAPPPPPPPPTHQSVWNNNNSSNIKTSKTFMFKYL